VNEISVALIVPDAETHSVQSCRFFANSNSAATKYDGYHILCL
jgi:hypothetical protein